MKTTGSAKVVGRGERSGLARLRIPILCSPPDGINQGTGRSISRDPNPPSDQHIAVWFIHATKPGEDLVAIQQRGKEASVGEVIKMGGSCQSCRSFMSVSLPPLPRR